MDFSVDVVLSMEEKAALGLQRYNSSYHKGTFKIQSLSLAFITA